MTLTERQLETLRFVWDYKQVNRIAPTLQEIADHFEIARPTAHEHLCQLVGMGMLDREKFAARGLTVTRAGREALGCLGGATPGTALKHAWDLATEAERKKFYKARVAPWRGRKR